MPDENKGSGKGINKYLDGSGFEESKIVRWIISVMFVGFAFINGLSISSLLLVVAGVLIIPIKAPEYLLRMLKPLTALIIAVSIILVGIIFSPEIFSGNKTTYTSPNNNQTINSGQGNSGGNQNTPSGSGQSSGSNSDEADDDSEDSTEGDDDPSGGSDSADKGDTEYILNTNSKKFHYPDCRFAETIKDENREEYFGSRQDLINDGYEPCKSCNPQ